MTLRIIGDCHQKYKWYFKILEDEPYSPSVQIGDMGFDYNPLIEYLSHTNIHFFFKGNHDNYRHNPLFDMGDFGTNTIAGVEFFFIRGAKSIDKQYRIEGVDWFREEELNWQQSNECIEQYERTKPSIVLSHDCPSFVFDYVSFTSTLLSNLFWIHKPNLWVFGHHHKSFKTEIEGCTFKCLDELEVFRI